MLARAPGEPAAVRLGSWELLALAGQGEFTRVYQARPLETPGSRADYAVKVARTDRADHAACGALVAREAAVAQRVAHPHLISVLATGIGDAPHYLVLPWLRGATLAERLRARQQFPLPVSLSIARQTSAALAALAAAGIRHGDVKPANLMLAPDGHITLLDLGFAAHRGEAPSLEARHWLGTPHYAAPERFTSRLAIDPQSDVYSLGVTLYRLLAGRLPFEEPTLEALAAAKVHQTPADLKALQPRLPLEVAQLVTRLLAKDPLRRPNAKELTSELARLEIEHFAHRAS